MHLTTRPSKASLAGLLPDPANYHRIVSRLAHSVASGPQNGLREE